MAYSASVQAEVYFKGLVQQREREIGGGGEWRRGGGRGAGVGGRVGVGG